MYFHLLLLGISPTPLTHNLLYLLTPLNCDSSKYSLHIDPYVLDTLCICIIRIDFQELTLILITIRRYRISVRTVAIFYKGFTSLSSSLSQFDHIMVRPRRYITVDRWRLFVLVHQEVGLKLAKRFIAVKLQTF